MSDAGTDKRSILVGLAVSAALGAAALCWGVIAEPRPPEPRPAEPPEVHGARPSAPRPDDAAGAHSPPTRSEAPAARSEDEPTWRGRAWRVRVVETGTGAPVPHAAVWLVPSESQRLSSLHHDRVELVRHKYDRGWRYRVQGHRIVTGADGCATWTADVGPEVEAFSERGTWCGTVSFDLRDRSHGDVAELELRPDVTVHVHVLDGRGAPVAAQLDWRLSNAGVDADEAQRWRDAEIGRDGLAIRHLGLESRQLLDGSWYVQARARVPGLAYSFSETVAVHPGETHLHVTLPALARVRLQWRDATGQPLPFPTSAILRRADSSDRSDHLWQPLVDAAASFPVVPGARYAVSLETLLVDKGHNHWEITAPADPGAEETSVLRLSPSLVTLSCRVVDARAEPVREQRLAVFGEGPRAGGFAWAETDVQGRAYIVLRSSWVDDNTDRVSLLVTSGEHQGQSADLLADGPLRPGHRELGDVAVGAVQLLLEGVVRREVTPTQENTRLRVERLAGGRHWLLQRVAVSWAGNKFEIRGTASPGEYRVRALAVRGQRRPSAWVGFRPGGESVELCLGPAAAAVEIPVRPLPGEKASVFVSAAPLAGDAILADEEERRLWRTGKTVQTKTSLWISRLPAGTYRLVVRCSVVPGPVHAVEVIVRDGDDVVRLAPIDLADHVREVPVRVLLHDGLPAREGRVTVFGEGNSKTTRTLRDGTATLWLDRPRDVEVRLPDGTAHRFEAVFAETELRLPPRER